MSSWSCGNRIFDGVNNLVLFVIGPRSWAMDEVHSGEEEGRRNDKERVMGNCCYGTVSILVVNSWACGLVV